MKTLKQLLKEHAADVKKGCTCPAPTAAHGMTFKPRAVDCPLHGELSS